MPNVSDVDEMAANTRIAKGETKIASIAIFTSNASIFLPRYSGVRPTISPAMNTVRTTKSNIP